MQDTGLDKDAGVEGEGDEALNKLDSYLCELKEDADPGWAAYVWTVA